MNVVIGNRNEELGNEVVKIIKSNGDARFLKLMYHWEWCKEFNRICTQRIWRI